MDFFIQIAVIVNALVNVSPIARVKNLPVQDKAKNQKEKFSMSYGSK